MILLELEIKQMNLKIFKDVIEENFPKMKEDWNFMEKENKMVKTETYSGESTVAEWCSKAKVAVRGNGEGVVLP